MTFTNYHYSTAYVRFSLLRNPPHLPYRIAQMGLDLWAAGRDRRARFFGPRAMCEVTQDRAREAIEAFSGAAGQPDLWPSALEKLSRVLGAQGCLLAGHPASSFAPVCSPSLENLLSQAPGKWRLEKGACIEKCLSAFEQSKEFVTGALAVPAREIDHPSAASEFIDSQTLMWYAAIPLAGHGPSSIILLALRSAKSGPFGEGELEDLRRLRPALQQAAGFALLLAAAHRDGLLAAYRSFGWEAIILDRNGRVLCANTEADRLASDALTIRNGFLTAPNRNCDGLLKKLVRSTLDDKTAANPGLLGPILIRQPDSSALLVYSAPLPSSAAGRFRQARAALIIVSPDARRASLVLDLQKIFGLTNSEAAIAQELSHGRDVEEIAANRKVTAGTLRAQLKTIFLKTGARRQSELVALIFRYAWLPRHDLG